MCACAVWRGACPCARAMCLCSAMPGSCSVPAQCQRSVVALWACCGLVVGLLAGRPERENQYRSALVARCSVPVSLCRAPLLASRLLDFRSWVVFLVAGVPRLTAGVLLPTVVCLFPVAVCLFPCVGLPFLLSGSLFFGPGRFFLLRACRVSPQTRWMNPVSRCSVLVYRRRGPAFYCSVPVARCSVPVSLCRAPLLASWLLGFRSWVVFLVSARCRVPVFLCRAPFLASRLLVFSVLGCVSCCRRAASHRRPAG